MPFDFPNSPTNGQTATNGGIVYAYDGTKWVRATGSGTGVTSWNTRTGAVTLTSGDVTAAGGAPLASPVFTGNPTAPTPSPGDADTSLATTAFVQAAVPPSVGKNAVHNSMFAVAQRGAGPFTANGAYTLDRWQTQSTLDAVSFSAVAMTDADRTAVGDESAATCLQNVFTGNAGASAFNEIIQSIESSRRLSGKTITLSFWAIAGAALKLGINGYQYYGAGGGTAASWAATGTAVQLSTTWTRYSATFNVPSSAGKTLGTAGTDTSVLQIFYSAGATNGPSAGNIGVQSGVVKIWGVQLEIGSVATPLEKPDPVMQLQQCQRFYCIGQVLMGSSNQSAGGGLLVSQQLPVTMRATPTVTPTASGGQANISGLAAGAYNGLSIYFSGNATVAGAAILGATFTASADL